MNKTLLAPVLAMVATWSGIVVASALVGMPAPDFLLADIDGRTFNLAGFKGKHVVLEWHNPFCPFVMKHHDSGNIPGLQAKYGVNDTVWLTINSTHPGHHDYLGREKLKAYLAEKRASPNAYLIDADGSVGRLYAARTTPHIYVVNPAGVLVYAGAIDDKRTTDPQDVRTATNYLVAALRESKAGKPVSMATTSPYGCSIKYR